MKRALALVAMLASAAAMSSPALAVGTPQYGSVKLQWNVAVAMTAVIHSSYTAAFAYAAPAGNLSNPAGTCLGTPGGANADLTLDYGSITPSLSATVGCTYLNAVGASVTDNDSTGVKVYQAFDAALPAGINVCAFPNTGAAFPMTPAAAITQSTRSGVGPAVFGGACGAGGALVPTAAGGAITGTAGTSTQVGGTGETYQNATSPYSIGGQNWISTAGQNLSAVLAGEDLQLNVAQTAASGNASAIMTVQFIPN